MSQIELTTEYIETDSSDTVDITAVGESVALEDTASVIDVDDEIDNVIELGVPGGIGPQGTQGTQGPQGIQGPPGPTGSTGLDLTYTFTQIVPSNQWVIVHNLGKQPAVEVVDSAGTTVVGDVVHDSIYQTTVNFSAPFGGTAFLN